MNRNDVDGRIKRARRRLWRKFFSRVLPVGLGLLWLVVDVSRSLALTPAAQPTLSAQPTPSPVSSPFPGADAISTADLASSVSASPATPQTPFPAPPWQPAPSPQTAPDGAADHGSPVPTVEPSPTPDASSDGPSTPPGTPTPDASNSEKPSAQDKSQDDADSPELKRLNQLLQGDELYREGNIAQAVELYQVAKPSFDDQLDVEQPEPVTAIEELPPAAKVYWREAQAGLATNTETRIFVPLKLLMQNYPQFLPAYRELALAYERYQQPEKALEVLEEAMARYPDQPDVLKFRIQLLARNRQWMDASIAARQFALLYPNHPQAAEFQQLADANLDTYRRELRRKLTGNVITNVITGAVGYALTGGLFGPLTALQTSVLLLQGESALGDRFVKQAKQSLELVDDQAVVDYVNELGARLGKSAGREDFNYEFFVINDENLNAFALPGGKIFINAGAIAKTHSEAELAGLLGHEIAHAVLGHGLQLLAQSSLTSSITQYIPYVGGLAESLITFSYSRDMERQADALGTRLLATNRLAADGLWSLMQTMEQEEKEKDGSRPPEWLSTHPLTADRVKTLKTLIQRGGYNRYAYEGVKEHAPIREKVQKMLQEEEEKTDKIRDRRQTQPTSPSPTPDPSPTPGPSPTPDPSPTPPTGQ